MSPRTKQLINQFGAAAIACGERRALDNGQAITPSKADKAFAEARLRLEKHLDAELSAAMERTAKDLTEPLVGSVVDLSELL